MVEHLVANQMMGVRFSLPAPREQGERGSGRVGKLLCPRGESNAGAVPRQRARLRGGDQAKTSGGEF